MLKVKRLHPNAKLPKRGTPYSAGLDLYCVEDHLIKRGAHVLIPTGIAIELPPGAYGRIAPRSGLAVSHGINVHAGVIDPDYRKEVKVALINHGQDDLEVRVGERIAQLIMEFYRPEDAVWVDDLSPSARGGFGSTGR